METLNLPAYDFRTREWEGEMQIYDPLRQQYVRLTPEEWVRQHFVQYLIREKSVPAGLISIERRFVLQDMPRRADVVVHSRQGRPLLVVECKAPEVPIRQQVFDQVARYNKALRAPYLVVTNGQDHYCCAIDFERHDYAFLDAIPAYESM